MSVLTLLSQISIFFNSVNWFEFINSIRFQWWFNKYFKIFIITYSSDFLNINLYLRGTFLIFVKNIFYKHVLIFLVEYFFASVKMYQTNFSPLMYNNNVIQYTLYSVHTYLHLDLHVQ